MKQTMIFRSLIVAGVISGATLGGYIAQNTMTPFNTAAAASAAAITPVQPGARVAVPDFTGIVEDNGAAVVNISVTGKGEKTAAAILAANVAARGRADHACGDRVLEAER